MLNEVLLTLKTIGYSLLGGESWGMSASGECFIFLFLTKEKL